MYRAYANGSFTSDHERSSARFNFITENLEIIFTYDIHLHQNYPHSHLLHHISNEQQCTFD